MYHKKTDKRSIQSNELIYEALKKLIFSTQTKKSIEVNLFL